MLQCIRAVRTTPSAEKHACSIPVSLSYWCRLQKLLQAGAAALQIMHNSLCTTQALATKTQAWRYISKHAAHLSVWT